MHIVKSFGVMSVAKIMGVLYACMGLLFAPFFLLFGLLGSLAGSMTGQGNSPFAGIVGVFVAVLLPFFYGVLDLLAGRLGPCCTTLFQSGWVDSKSRWSCGQQLPLRLTRLSLPPLPASDLAVVSDLVALYDDRSRCSLSRRSSPADAGTQAPGRGRHGSAERRRTVCDARSGIEFHRRHREAHGGQYALALH